MKYQMTLDYTIPFGDLAPYFEALQVGKALASECIKCGYVAFPARINCGACGSENTKWTPLKGTAHIQFQTDGASDSFALVKFDGADTASTVGLLNPNQETTIGSLVAPRGDAPGLWVELTSEHEEERQ
jgi:uncharacterized OB-fold protein